MAKINPTAIVDPRAELAENVEIGPYCIVESDVKIGPGTVLRDHAVVRRYTILGAGNFLDAFVVLGGEPQDLKFSASTVSYLRVGEGNVFREGVTISRATGEGNVTVVGDKTYWMAQSHAGHNAVIDDGVILGNYVAVGGHAHIHRRTILSAYTGIHQFCWVGEMVMAQGGSGISAHVPPFTITANGVNKVVGLNRVGLQRSADITGKDRAEIKEAFRLTYRAGLGREKCLAEMDAHAEWGEPAGKFRQFIRDVYAAEKPYTRGLAALRRGKTVGED